ncbi:MAG: hypothetical protein HYX68_18250 [Planctomycetes bacterium]|jgi:hypothetical protein|nr:hypothetical protein [Planctomycetota bacterium]
MYSMRTQFLTLVFSSAIVVGLLGGTPAAAQTFYFMKLISPEEMQVYAPSATCTVVGVVALPDAKKRAKVLFLRFRVYEPRRGGFLIANEALARVDAPPAGTNLMRFKQPFRLPLVSGAYLLRVDCMDFAFKDPAKSIITSQSIFIELKGSNDARPGHKTVLINTPTAGSKFGKSSSITVGGTSTGESVTQMRIRFMDGTKIVQEVTVNVSSGNFSAMLMPPPVDGWPVGTDKKIVAQGLDKGSSPVSGEERDVTITIEK